MNSQKQLPSIDELKSQAKRLRADLASNGTSIIHAKSLEMIAHLYGMKDWNALYSKVGNQMPTCPVHLGQRVRGKYLGQDFAGEVVLVENLATHGRYRTSFIFDEPVDVVTFEGFSNFRKRVTCTIQGDGTTLQKTSNGVPHLELKL